LLQARVAADSATSGWRSSNGAGTRCLKATPLLQAWRASSWWPCVIGLQLAYDAGTAASPGKAPARRSVLICPRAPGASLSTPADERPGRPAFFAMALRTYAACSPSSPGACEQPAPRWLELTCSMPRHRPGGVPVRCDSARGALGGCLLMVLRRAPTGPPEGHRARCIRARRSRSSPAASFAAYGPVDWAQPKIAGRPTVFVAQGPPRL